MAARYMIKAEQCVLSEGKMSEGKVYVTVTGDTITSIDTAEPPPTGCPIISTHLLTPGFIDIHLHGLGGADDVIDFWTNPGHTLSRLPAKGTTGCLATIVLPKEGREKTRRLAERLGECVGVPGMGAILEGIHAEGPVVNDCGGLPVSDVDITLDDFQSLIDSMQPHLKVMTISPHLEAKNNYSRIKALLERGIKPALGHDRVASEADIIGALRQSSDQLHITHIFNVSSFNNRNPSLVNFGMLKRFPNLPEYNDLPLPPTVEVIGDLAHVHPLTLSLLLQSRDPRDVCFITDGVYEASSPGQSISYNERTLISSHDCKTMVLDGTTTIAGSCVSMIDMFHYLIDKFDVSIPDAVTMLSRTPARVAGLEKTGGISVGNRADLLLFDNENNLMETFVAGESCWKRD